MTDLEFYKRVIGSSIIFIVSIALILLSTFLVLENYYPKVGSKCANESEIAQNIGGNFLQCGSNGTKLQWQPSRVSVSISCIPGTEPSTNDFLGPTVTTCY